MPYKFTEGRRHKFPKARYRVANWPDYDAALVRRGDLTVWFTEEAVAAWHAPATGQRGGQPTYSAITIETALGIDIAIPDHTTLSRRRWPVHSAASARPRRATASSCRQHRSEDLRRR